MFIQNTDTTKLLIFDRIFVQVVGIASIPGANEYFSMGFGRTFSSGGADVVPVNQNKMSTSAATGLFKTTSPTLIGTYTESHRWYAQGNGVAFETISARANDIILGRSNTLEIRYISAGAVGTALTLAKFYYATREFSP